MKLLKNAKLSEVYHLNKIQNGVLSFPKIFNAQQKLRDLICLQQFMFINRQNIQSDLRNYGAILFRGFDIKSPNESIALLKHLGFIDFGLLQNQLNKVVGSKDKQILNTPPLCMFSCESQSEVECNDQKNKVCRKIQSAEFIGLYCFQPALKGGNISLVKWKQVLEDIQTKHPSVLNDLNEKGITKISILPQFENSTGKGWRKRFNISNREEGQKLFRQRNYEFEWINNQKNELRLLKTKKNLRIQNLINEIIQTSQNCGHQMDKLSEILTYGDGSRIPHQFLSDICQYTQKVVCNLQIKQGDLLIINNNMVKHLHCPFEGPAELRKIYVSFMKLQTEYKNGDELYQILNNGYKLPLIGFGTWKIKKEQAEEVVYNAIKSGYRLIDCAPVYQNQVQVGKGIKRAIDENIVQREDLFITSKLWNTNHRPQHVLPACQQTLKNMGLKYLDLYLMHYPIGLKYRPINEQKYPQWSYDQKAQKQYILEEKVPVTQTWKAMQNLIVQNLVRNIGVSNFTVALLRELIYSCSIKPSVHQTEIHPELNQKKSIRYARQEGIQITSYSSFGASSYFEIGYASKEDQKPIYEHEKIKFIAEKHQRTPHQILLRWAIQQGLAVIPKSVKPMRMKQNLDIIEFLLDQEDMNEIQKLHRGRRYNDPGDFCLHNFGKFYPLHE